MKYPVYAAAAVALLAIVGIIAFNAFSPRLNVAGPGPIDSPDLTESPTPARGSPVAAPVIAVTPSCLMARSPTDLNEDSRGRLDPGTYSYCGVGRQGLLNVRFTVPAGWEWHGTYLSKASSVEEARVSFLEGNVQVYTDPCLWSESEPDPPTGRTVTDLIDALAAQPMRDASTPTERYAYGEGSDRALPPSAGGPGPMDWKNGFAGMAIELTVPGDLDLADCDEGQFRSWGHDHNVRAHLGAGQRDLVWVITTCPENCATYERLVIDASWMPATPSEVLTEMDAILESIATGHWG